MGSFALFRYAAPAGHRQQGAVLLCRPRKLADPDGGLNILVDPVWSERASPVSFAGPKRVNDPGIAFDKLPTIDVVLVSHGHYDHLDARTLSKLAAKFSPRVITPLGNDVTMMSNDAAIRAEGFDWNQRIQIGNGVAVTLVATRHWTARGLFDRNKALWASFVLETPAGKLYLVADSGYGTGTHFRRVREAHGPIRAAILPIGAYEPRWFMREMHMNPEDAVKALADCGAEMALAHHHGTFQLTDEAIDAPVNDLATALDAAGGARQVCRAQARSGVRDLSLRFRHCERSAAIHSRSGAGLFVASLLAMTRITVPSASVRRTR
jgi:L-ascorbate metabolism protein UlaG (beta-lactamase superfamily)